MPSLFAFGPYIIFFWTGEQGEPVHVHVAVKRPSKDATKLWLTASGGCIVAHNNSQLPERDLRRVAKFIRSNHELICRRWCETFGEDSLHFFSLEAEAPPALLVHKHHQPAVARVARTPAVGIAEHGRLP